MKDQTCTARKFIVTGETVDVPGFVRVLDCTAVDEIIHLIVLCDEDPIVWRLRLQIVQLDTPTPCLTGLANIGRWSGMGCVFMYPPARAGAEPWVPNRADMTLVTP